MGRRKKGLSPEDRDLWDRVKRTARPLEPHRAVKPAKPSVTKAPPEKTPESQDLPPMKPFRLGETAMPVQRNQPERPHHAPPRMQANTHRKMVRGKLKPEARIDLHGMTLSDAHPALIGFVSGAWDRGLRLVLVITGKGRGGFEDDGPVPVRRGVLRRQVPHWLTAPPLGAMVLDITEAHQRHGGEGAFYVYLRRRR
ncbi:Smr/MutS family protein [Roseibacterium sp. SDUM158016]|uniref:Smr/MutS family protein n=1 Tax=Roseicyclus sediminis TaxID=2980997 RepID=UPI0021CEE4E5|nr:Smr/MutS family protein [Roseibacterium sp. SDUM158016]MCU4652294.1 Smr/MutS family protein [Roseibacterium sp. SDUM158016]